MPDNVNTFPPISVDITVEEDQITIGRVIVEDVSSGLGQNVNVDTATQAFGGKQAAQTIALNYISDGAQWVRQGAGAVLGAVTFDGQKVDDSPFTVETDTVIMMGAIFDDVAPD